MNAKFLLSILVVACSITALIYTAVRDTAKAVVTVAELRSESVDRPRIRLGARVFGPEIKVTSEPERTVQFSVTDPGTAGEQTIPVIYHGAMPDTLQVGRDVILEGNYRIGRFEATSLMTQCPSKYEPPVPGQATNEPKGY